MASLAVPKRVALFEPWGLGDTVIALVAARELRAQGATVTIVCDRRWAAWVETLPFVDRAIPCRVPWTDRRRKYWPPRYRWRDFLALRRSLASARPEILCDLRGDLRSVALLRALGAPVVSLAGRKFRCRYDRTGALLEKLGATARDRGPTPFHAGGTHRRVACFFGGSWRNKQVPFATACRLVSLLVERGHRVTVILESDAEAALWRDPESFFGHRLSILRASVAGIGHALPRHDAVVSTDSGWLHVAAFLGLPVVGLFAFRNDAEWAPPGSRIVHAAAPGPDRDRFRLSREHVQPLGDLDCDRVLTALASFSETTEAPC